MASSTLHYTSIVSLLAKTQHNSLMSYQSGPSSPTIFADDNEWCNEHWPELEFRSPEDEAWYAVEVTEMCDALLINFKGFTCEYDEFYPSDDFKTADEVQEFEERFRACSVQMQDIECPKVIEGTKVCATCPSVTGEVKFYDAIVVAVSLETESRN